MIKTPQFFSTMSFNKIILFCLFFSLSRYVVSAGEYYYQAPAEQKGNLLFVKNEGQWPEAFQFKAALRGGALFLEDHAMTFSFLHPDDWAAFHDHRDDPEHTAQFPSTIHGAGLKLRFLQSDQPAMTGKIKMPAYHNYFLGSEATWRSDVPLYKEVIYQNLYPKTNLYLYQYGEHLKYDFVLQAGADPSAIQIKIEGAERQWLDNGQLIIQTAVNELYMHQALAWQIIKGQKVPLGCSYELDGDIIRFNLSDDYNPKYPLVIDPVLTFSTYTGSTADNWGFTATYDQDGNFYAGGIAFATGYPVVIGSFQTNFAGGSGFYRCDVSITKFNASGDSLLFSTYLGGSHNEIPHSMIVNSQNELLVYGTTASLDFPHTSSAYDTTFNGGSTVNLTAVEFLGGSDIFISHFNEQGTTMLGSTYIGGMGNDGLNYSSNLNHNYADHARGEILVDDNDRVIVVSCTNSPDFPSTAGAFQPLNAGQWDACIFQFDANLQNLNWSSYLGGSSNDAAYSAKVGKNDIIYVCGGTSSTDFPTTNGSLNPSFQGGVADGFVLKLSAQGTNLMQSTYIGTFFYDQTYGLDLDVNQNVYIIGQTAGPYPTTAGVYSNPGSGQFVSKLDNTLSTLLVSTVFGKSDGDPEFVPTAFMVDVCGRIYMAGWGGAVNGSVGNLIGYTTTPDAYQLTTDGSDFYFLVLSEDMQSRIYATFFGGPTSHEHVDGGTSRFDKTGIIYEAVCAGCGGNSDFPYTPGAWSANNNSSNCNEGAAKFEFQLPIVQAQAVAGPKTQGCSPLQVNFNNTGSQNMNYQWDFGDGQSSTSENPSHSYTTPGTYLITLIVTDTMNCHTSDTALVSVQVFGNATADFTWDSLYLNPGDTVDFQNLSTGASAYDWGFGDGSSSNLQDPSHAFQDTGNFQVCLKAKNAGACDDSICYTIFISDYAIVDVPTAFSPNSDGKNDIYYARGQGVDQLELKIYNRWGQLLFTTTNLKIGWDGTYKGMPQAMDVYVFVLNATLNSGDMVYKKGNFTLIR